MSIFFKNGRYYIDYRPDGRYGKRVRQLLPESIASEDEAREIEKDIKQALHGGKKQFMAAGSTVDDLFPEYLISFSRLRRSAQWFCPCEMQGLRP